ncbi:ribokinase [Pycnococcus provasolii]
MGLGRSCVLARATFRTSSTSAMHPYLKPRAFSSSSSSSSTTAASSFSSSASLQSPSSSAGGGLTGVRRILASFILSSDEIERLEEASASASASAPSVKDASLTIKAAQDQASAEVAAARASLADAIAARASAEAEAKEARAQALMEIESVKNSQSAAMQTIQNDLKNAQSEIVKAKKDVEKAVKVERTKLSELKNQLKAAEAAATAAAAASTASATVEATPLPVHPLLNVAPAVDLGYKKLFHADIASLLKLQENTPVWRKQRMFRPERAKAIALYKAKRGQVNPVSLPGIVTLVEETDGNMYVLDGQHRLGALRVLHEKGLAAADEKVMVEVFYPRAPSSKPSTMGDDAEGASDMDGDADAANAHDIKRFAELLFKEINQAEPLRDVDWPDVSDRLRAVLEETVQTLRGKYPKMFSASARYQSPHVNVDVLKDELFQALFGDSGDGKGAGLDAGTATVDGIIAFVEERNSALAKRKDSTWTKGIAGKGKDKRLKALEKAKANGFFLGVVPGPSWLDAK